MENESDLIARRVAAFLVQALDLEEEPAALAHELVALKQDTSAGIWTVELDSSVGPAAFLAYHYLLLNRDEQGRTGRELFEADLATLQQAAERAAPGPRMLAHALAGDEAYILATTPATFRALTGIPESRDAEAAASGALSDADAPQARRESAAELLRLLGEAERQARIWSAAIDAESSDLSDEASAGELIAFNEEETALALFLLDERSIQHLLRVLNLFIESARRQTATAVKERPRQRD